MLSYYLSTMKKTKNRISETNEEENGFTLAEIVISATIIIVVMAVFTTFMANFAKTQRLSLERGAAEQIMRNQTENMYALPWSALVSDERTGDEFSGRLAQCALVSGSYVQLPLPTAPETVPMYLVQTSDNLTRKNVRVITRVEWADGTKVTCANKDREGLKKVYITIQWETEGGKTSATTTAVYRSKHASPS